MNYRKDFDRYKKENKKLLKYINERVEEKHKDYTWDCGITGSTQMLTTLLMYEYSTSIEKITGGKISALQVCDRLFHDVAYFRYGEFHGAKEEELKYEGYSIGSKEYNTYMRIKSKNCAHTVISKNKKDEEKIAIAVFDDTQTMKVKDKYVKLSGIDLQDLADIRQAVFREWTHVMERCKVKKSDLSKENMIFSKGDSTYINFKVPSGFCRAYLKKYILNNDKFFGNDETLVFDGLETIEIDNKHDKKAIKICSKVRDAATEYITRKVLENVGEEVKNQNRYAKQAKLMGDIFEKQGGPEAIAIYLTKPYETIRSLESRSVGKKDMLHYVSEYIESSSFKQLFMPSSVNENGEIEGGFFKNVARMIKQVFSRKKTLPQGEENVALTSKDVDSNNSSSKDCDNATNNKDDRAAYVDGIKIKYPNSVLSQNTIMHNEDGSSKQGATNDTRDIKNSGEAAHSENNDESNYDMIK